MAPASTDLSTRHVCREWSKALADGFVRDEGGCMKLADLRSRGSSGSQFESRWYGPTIAFCPFCGALLAEDEHAEAH